MATETLPLFPLSQPVFPEGLLRLTIFEVRYLHLIRRCQQEGIAFGVVPLADGHEVQKAGAQERLHDIGCRVQLLYSQAAQIVARQELAFELPSRPADAHARLLERFPTVDGEKLQVFGREEWFAPVASGSNPPDALIKDTSERTFVADVIEPSRDVPVLVDFWAPWCGPCRMVGPVVEEIARDFAGQVKVGKMNVDNNERVPGQFNISSIPTLLVFKGGKLVGQIVGAVPKSKIEVELRRHL